MKYESNVRMEIRVLVMEVLSWVVQLFIYGICSFSVGVYYIYIGC